MEAAADVTVVTWNVQGAKGLDAAAVARFVTTTGATVVALQEVQRRQAAAVAQHLGWPSPHWTFKHLPFPDRAEGAAVLSPAVLGHRRRIVLRRQGWHSWRRRVAQVVVVPGPRRPLVVANAHLSAHDDEDDRLLELGVLLPRLETMAAEHGGDALLVGDLNALPTSPVLGRCAAAGWVDAWPVRHHDGGETAWSGLARRDRQPADQRLDYVLVRGELAVVDAAVPAPTDASYRTCLALSDHLPLAVQVTVSS